MLQAMTQQDVAALANTIGSASISQFRVSQLERGLNPRPDECKVLSELFNVPPEELFGRV